MLQEEYEQRQQLLEVIVSLNMRINELESLAQCHSELIEQLLKQVEQLGNQVVAHHNHHLDPSYNPYSFKLYQYPFQGIRKD